MKKILLFGFHGLSDEMTVYHLKGAFEKTGVEIRKIGKEDYLQPLGMLAGMLPEGMIPGQKQKAYQGEELSVRILLFAGFSQEELEQGLNRCRECGIGREDLKAVLTPYNLAWNVRSLCGELKREHQQMRNGSQTSPPQQG